MKLHCLSGKQQRVDDGIRRQNDKEENDFRLNERRELKEFL